MTAEAPARTPEPGQARSSWEATSDTAPPPEVSAVLKPGEKPLWATTVSSTGSAASLFWMGSIVAISVCLVAFVAPWGRSVDTFCPPDQPTSCQKVYYSIFLWVFVGGLYAPWMYWISWKARYRPWLWHCTVTTTRALLIDGRGPRLSGAVDLSRHPPLAEANSRLAFGKKPIRLAVWGALPLEDRRRALYWARQAATRMEDAS